MTQPLRVLFVIGLAVLGGCAPKAPIAERRPHTMEKFGDVRVDDYYWLNDPKDSKTIAYLNAENDYTVKAMRPLQALQKRLKAEQLSHLAEDDASVPYEQDGWLYWHEVKKGQDYPVYYRKPAGGGGAISVLLDLNSLGKDKPYINLGTLDISDDGQRMAYTLDFTGGLDFVLFVQDLTNGKLLGEPVSEVADATFVSDNRTLVVTRYDEAKRPYRVELRPETGEATMIYEEANREFEVGCSRTRSGRYVALHVGNYDADEVRVLDSANPTAAPVLVAARRPGFEYDLDQSGDFFYIRANDRGRNFRLVKAPVATPDESHWQEVIAARDDVMIEDVEAFENFLVIGLRENGRPALRTLALDAPDAEPQPLKVPVWLATVLLGDNAEFSTDRVRVIYESLATPAVTADVSVGNGAVTELKRQRVPGYDASKYEERRVFTRATDGTMVPVTLVYKKGLPPGPRPLVLWGYGSYGLPEWPWFAAERLPLLDRGIVLGVAQLRGGGDYGQLWADAGKLANKMNTFTDFIAAAKGLIEQGVTSSDRLIIHGASAGGLLVGAATNLEPTLFRGVVLQVPFVDALTTMLDDSLPLTTQEYTQWGNPNEEAPYRTIRSYSPYDNLKAGNYPRRLVLTSINDNQVRYHEPAKYVARSRALGAKGAELLLQCNMEAGHGGSSSRYAALDEAAFIQAWMLQTLKLEKQRN